MTYQVLARKWRPKNFADFVGQQHVVQALANALDTERLHHAYLFTGTRGVGKTTLARILAMCFNCEQGITSKPCNTCGNCTAIREGKFVDLIEVDAASRTKVEDTRELLDNVQYAPAQGRFKVYLIDEVHMLSGHSFNALLKTLEEPPAHVKFLLATTDPKKMPITVLSRCLQFHLHHMPMEQIQQHFEHILTTEKIPFEKPALHYLAEAAQGSMRDGLSLLDQAIAHGHGEVKTVQVSDMIGRIDQHHLIALLDAITRKDGHALYQQIETLAGFGADFVSLLRELIALLHHIAVAQAIPSANTWEHHAEPGNAEKLQSLADSFSKEEVQLLYQIALMGQRDLPYAPTPHMGFEMTLLRMLAFQPQTGKAPAPTMPIATTTATPEKKTPADKVDWLTTFPQLQLTGAALLVAQNCTVATQEKNQLTLTLDSQHATLLNNKLQQRIETALQTHLGSTITVKIVAGTPAQDTPATHDNKVQQAKQQAAQATIKNDPVAQQLSEAFGAEFDTGSIKPRESDKIAE